MKELSIEGKATRYDQAIKVAKSKIKNDKDHVLYEDDVIEIFPELKESEDDMMRAMAIKAVHAPEAQSCIKGWGINPDDVIAWLEKQGEKGINGNKGEFPIPEPPLTIKHAKEVMEIEQKPADEIPYPETLEKAIDLYYYSYGNGKGEFEHLSLERFRDIVYTFVNDYGQKPVWSEEDIMRINNLIAIIENRGYPDYVEYLEKLKDRVQLQPKQEWKPSDEQMEALWNVYRGGKEQAELATLYSDLKKLRNE